MKLTQKIFEIQKVCNQFKKNEKGFNFEYTNGNELLKVIRPKMDELGVMCIPEMIGTPTVDRYQTKNKKGEDVQNFCVSGQMRFNWIDSDTGETLSFMWNYFGDNNDPSQALGNALTYNERYNWLKSFHIQTDKDDPDIRAPHNHRGSEKADTYTSYVFKSGKMTGKTFPEITDKGWLQWMVDKGTNEDFKKHAIRRIAELGNVQGAR